MSTLHVENLKGLSSGSNANKIIVPSGQTLHAAGHVIQTVFVNDSNKFSSSSTSFTDTNLTATITPKLASSKILVFSNLTLDVACGGVISARLLRGSTVLKTEGYWNFITAQGTNDYILMRQPHHYLDSPSTTSAITYKWQLARTSGTALSHFLSYDEGVNNNETDSQLVLQEIAQ